VSQVFQVLLGNRARVDAALAALAKRAARKGLTPIAWTWGKATTEKELIPHPEFGWKVECRATVSRVPLTLEGDAPHYDGWTFVAALQHLDGENIVRAVNGAEVPSTYRTRGPVCDHCKANRRRCDTYVLRHQDSRHVQVGSTCVGDFLGSNDAAKLASAASMLSEARGLAEEGCEGFGAGSGDITLTEYLPFVAYCVREHGWMSRTAAREQGGGQATADEAMRYTTDAEWRKKCKVDPTAEDIATAAACETWAESLTDEQVNADRGDYMHNLRVIARSGIVCHKSAGLAGSMVVAYQRAIGRERERAARAARPVCDAYVGTVGKRETWDVTLDFVTGYDTAYGYTTVLKFRTPEGACIVWKATSTDLARDDVGKAYKLTGTVKKHDEYKGAKQTMVSRCRAEEVK
jgi:hypothetical protein